MIRTEIKNASNAEILLDRLVSYLRENPCEELSLPQLRDISPLDDPLASDRLIFSMATGKCAALELRFKLVEPGGVPHSIPVRTIMKALMDDRLIDQRTGHEIEQFKEKIYVCFGIGAKLIKTITRVDR